MDAEPAFITGSVFRWGTLLAVSIIARYVRFVCRRSTSHERPYVNEGCAVARHTTVRAGDAFAFPRAAAPDAVTR